jgi:HD-GYP domain-containing protein (c-di-GMP phosphodiesterase class II)
MIKSDHIPLAADRDHPRSVLMVLEDVTEIVAERERRERTMRDLVGTLVSLVDRRDPFSANHSALVAELSAAIAQEMGQPEDVRRTVDIAGNLMNLGKILVPESILTKTGRLTEAEMNTVRESMVQTADLLGGVSFDLPVAETLRQLQERWDGQGYPDGRSGEDILVSARIVMVANTFVGMVSPRAFRGALPVEEAISQLQTDAGSRYDRRPIAALLNYLENRGGAERWRRLADDTPEA